MLNKDTVLQFPKQNKHFSHYGLVTTYIRVSIGSGNGLLPGGTKP